MSELMEQLEDSTAPNLVSTIAQTLIFMAPVFWLFYNIKIERIDLLMVNGIAAVFGTAFTTWNWIHYVNQYRKNRTRIKKKTRKMIWMVPKDYLFMEQGPVTGVILIWLIMIPAILFCILIIRIISKQSARELEGTNDILLIWNHLGKWRPLAISVWLIGIYCCVTNFTAVTSDQIICFSPAHPLGIEYNYTDVKSINTGFGDKNFSIPDYKKNGSFFYQIKINGKTITFHTPSTNGEIKRYEEHTYLELEEFDQALVDLKIPKSADKKGWKNCDFDKEYVDRFLRIIELK